MLDTQMNALVESGQIKTFTVIKIADKFVNDINGKQILCVLKCEVVGQASAKINSPTRFIVGEKENTTESVKKNAKNNTAGGEQIHVK